MLERFRLEPTTAMDSFETLLDETGLQVISASGSGGFAHRPPRPHSVAREMEAMERIAKTLIENSSSVLQELVDAAISLCGADSAGISIEKDDRTDEKFYQWVATAGQYSGFLDAELPRYPSACSLTLERGEPQLFRVGKKFFDIMGVEAPLITDGILLPWDVDGMRGTIFVMAHGRMEAFDEEDTRIMKLLSNFVAMAMKQKERQRQLMKTERAAAAASMANDLAHQINNPLQSLTNVLYLASAGKGGDSKEIGQQAMVELSRLSALVSELLKLPLSEK